MVASDSPGDEHGASICGCEDAFHLGQSAGLWIGLIRPLAMEIGEFVYLWRARLDG